MITPRAIEEQVRAILASDAFVRCRRMQRFLEFIVTETLAGRADQLGEYSIGVTVFDRGEDFEPALDPIVRNDARRLRLKLHEYYRTAESGLIIEIPKGGYVPVFFTERRTPTRRRLAVLPFEALCRDSEPYGRALGHSLTAHLTNREGLEAIAHGYLQELPFGEAASKLRLSHAIRGSVIKVKDRCRVIVNLIHLVDGTQLWAREYDFHDSQLHSIPSEIADHLLPAATSSL